MTEPSKSRSRRIANRSGLVAAALLVSAGVSGVASASSSPHSKVEKSSNATTSLTIGISNPNAAQFLPFLASTSGYFRRQHVAADVEVLPPAELIADLASGSVQFGVVSPPQVEVAVLQSRANIKYYATWTLRSQLEFLAAPGINSVAQLRGKPIGLSAPGTVSDLLWDYLLHSAGLSLHDVNGIPFTSSQTVNAAFLSGQVDAVPTAPPLSFALEKAKPGSKIIANFATKKDFLWPQAEIAGNSTWVVHNQKAAIGVMVALQRALQRWHSDPAAAEAVITTNISGITPAEASAAYKASLQVFTKNLLLDPVAAERNVLHLLASNGYPTARRLSPASIINTTVLTKALKQLGMTAKP